MKKLLLAIVMLLMLIPSLCFADPVITSDSRTFNPMTGVYDLQGNVFVQFPVHDTTLTITGDSTKVYMYAMEVHGSGNIKLSFGDVHFNCDKVDVYHSNRTAYVNGNLHHRGGRTRDHGCKQFTRRYKSDTQQRHADEHTKHGVCGHHVPDVTDDSLDGTHLFILAA